MCGSASTPPPPGPSADEQALQKQQLSLLQGQQQQMQAFSPLLASQYGYDVGQQHSSDWTKTKQELESVRADLHKKVDAGQDYSGTYNRMKELENQLANTREFDYTYTKNAQRAAEEEQAAAIRSREMGLTSKSYDLIEQQIADYEKELAADRALEAEGKLSPKKQLEKDQLEISLLQAERQRKALQGELPVSEATSAAETKEFQLLKESMARSGNPIIGDSVEDAYSLTTSGAQNLDLFKKRFGLLKDQERRGEISQGAGIFNASYGIANAGSETDYARLRDLTGMGSYAQTSNAFRSGNPYADGAGLAGAYGGALQPYQQDRNMQWQSSMANADRSAQQQAGYMSLIGSGGGMAASALPMLLASSKTYKKNLKKTGKEGEKKSLDLIRQGDIYEYDYKKEPTKTKRHHVGVVTEEAPREIVSKDGKHLDVVNYLGTLSGAVRELDRKISRLSLH